MLLEQLLRQQRSLVLASFGAAAPKAVSTLKWFPANLTHVAAAATLCVPRVFGGRRVLLEFLDALLQLDRLNHAAPAVENPGHDLSLSGCDLACAYRLHNLCMGLLDIL